MRLKIKVWDKANCTMISDPLAWKDLREQLIDEENGQLNNDNERFVFILWTGLKDKNGKEIYEGDILRDKDAYRPYTITFNQDICGFVMQIGDSEYWVNFNPDTASSREVIGNIYENPELLK